MIRRAGTCVAVVLSLSVCWVTPSVDARVLIAEPSDVAPRSGPSPRSTTTARPIEVEGVLPASLDQPRIYMALFTSPKSDPLVVQQQAMVAGMEQLRELGLLDDADMQPTFAIEAFLDTGASGIMLSKPTTDALGLIPHKMPDGKEAEFFDVGVAGMEAFAISQPLYIRAAGYGGDTSSTDRSQYHPAAAGVRLKLRKENSMLDTMTGGVDVAGMPVMLGRVMLVDARPLRDLSLLDTRILPPGDSSIPRADTTIRLTYVDFTRFTQRDPANAPPATLAPNPLIGPDPFKPNDPTPGIILRHGDQQTSRTMLLDTGAASSFISSDTARSLGIQIDDEGNFTNVPAGDQFSLPIGGVGGIKTVRGLYVDGMEFPSMSGRPVRFKRVPVMVLDISVNDEASGQTYTLDGVLGMNLFVASANITGGSLAGLDEVREGAFDFITIDHRAGTLGLTVRKDLDGNSQPESESTGTPRNRRGR